MDDRWRQIEELFHSAADLAPAERSAFLARACAGDDELRRQVESLLAQDGAKDNVFETAVANAATLQSQQIGPYIIGEPIGRGGMGEVYRRTASAWPCWCRWTQVSPPFPAAIGLADFLIHVRRARFRRRRPMAHKG
jgi:hypothetical protein